MGVKIGKKRKLKAPVVESNEEEHTELPPTTRSSDEPPLKKVKWINKQRVLVFAARGISHRDRHLMADLRTLMPHCRSENKMERRENLFVVNEVCEMRNCNKAVLLEGRHQRDLYMWLANTAAGPSAKFLVENVYTMAELKLTGNCLKGTRPLLSFDKVFDAEPHYQLLKELLIQIFGTPNGHPKSQPFIDHVLTFSVLDNRIWFRNYQILSEDGALAEIGPRFVLNPIKIFDGSFGGSTLWENPHYVSPAKYRRLINKSAASKYLGRVTQKAQRELRKPTETYLLEDGDDIFTGDPFQKAQEIIEKEEEKSTIPSEESSSKQLKKMKSKKNKQNTSQIANNKAANTSSTSLSLNENKKDVPLIPRKIKNIKNKKIAALKLKKAKLKAKASI